MRASVVRHSGICVAAFLFLNFTPNQGFQEFSFGAKASGGWSFCRARPTSMPIRENRPRATSRPSNKQNSTTQKAKAVRFLRGKRMTQMAATAHALATKEALKVLREGGTAMDAAITAAFVLGVVEPYSSGMGGGGFLVAYNHKTKKTETLDFRERAPLVAHEDFYTKLGPRGKIFAYSGHLAVGTPGMVAGMEAIFKKYGSLPWKRLLEPAIRYAQKGFAINGSLARNFKHHRKKLWKFDSSRQTFYPKGRRLREGHMLYQRDLAWSLSRLRKLGAKDFYQGEIARRIVEEMKKNGGAITLADLKKYRVFWGKPFVGNYRGYQVHSMGSPSSGGAHLIQMLNILSGYPLDKMEPDEPLRLHLLTESMRLAFADRAKFQGDARFASVPNLGITSPQYAAELRKKISLTKAIPKGAIGAGNPVPYEKKHTSHLSIIDKFGNAVAMTLTINTSFGSGVTAKGTGIILNNEMDDFTANPGRPNFYGLIQGKANSIEPLKTPLSSMTPTLVFKNGKLKASLGSPGGPRIITIVLQLILNMIDHQMTPQQAMRFPRLHHQWMPDRLRIEKPCPSIYAVHRLRAMGHNLRVRKFWGNAMILWLDPKKGLIGSADPRGEGIADGF